MSKLYNKPEDKIIKLDPLGSALDDAGHKGGVGRINKLKVRKQKNLIQKIPNKNFREDKIYELSTGKKGSIVSGKKNKEKAIKEQISIAGKMTAKGDEYLPPFRKGGRVEYSKGTMPARNKKNFRPTEKGAGMTQAGVKAYRRLNPGSKLKTAVTGKVKPGSKAAKRRKSYCARSLGQLKRASAKTRNDPNSRIRQARRRWKC